MATPKKPLSERMKPRTTTPTPKEGPSTVADSFKAPAEEFPKRLTLDLSEAQHRKIKIKAMDEKTTMTQLLRDYIESLP